MPYTALDMRWRLHRTMQRSVQNGNILERTAATRPNYPKGQNTDQGCGFRWGVPSDTPSRKWEDDCTERKIWALDLGAGTVGPGTGSCGSGACGLRYQKGASLSDWGNLRR